MIVEFQDSYQERLYKGNKALVEAYETLDPRSATYFEELEKVSKLQKEIASDYKQYGERIEAERSDALEEEKTKAEKKAGFWRNIISAGGIVVTLVTFFIGEHNRNARIDKVCDFEEEHAILKSSEKIAVSDSLKEDRKGGFLGGLFK